MEAVEVAAKVAAVDNTVVPDMVLDLVWAPAQAWLVQTHMVDLQVQAVVVAAGVLGKVEATLDPVVTESVVAVAMDSVSLIHFLLARLRMQMLIVLVEVKAMVKMVEAVVVQAVVRGTAMQNLEVFYPT